MTDQDRERLEKIHKHGFCLDGFYFLLGFVNELDEQLRYEQRRGDLNSNDFFRVKKENDELRAEVERLKADFESNEHTLIEIHEALDGLPMGGPSEPGAKSRPYFTAKTRIQNLRAENERLKLPYNSVFECEACHALSRVSIERPVRVEK